VTTLFKITEKKAKVVEGYVVDKKLILKF